MTTHFFKSFRQLIPSNHQRVPGFQLPFTDRSKAVLLLWLLGVTRYLARLLKVSCNVVTQSAAQSVFLSCEVKIDIAAIFNDHLFVKPPPPSQSVSHMCLSCTFVDYFYVCFIPFGFEGGIQDLSVLTFEH